MKAFLRNRFLLPALMACLAFMMAGRVRAQTFTILYSFSPLSNNTNSDGAFPDAGLILSGSTLYGTARNGGSHSNGTVFAINIDGSGFTNLHSFTATSGPISTNSDGANPAARLILSGSTLFGTAQAGGRVGKGTMFAVNTDGTAFTNLHTFSGVNDGSEPLAGLVLSDNALYGTTYGGGTSAQGTVFKINTNGTGFTNLHNFNSLRGTDGANPSAGLILSANTLYGTAYYGGGGGLAGSGTVFKVNTDGTGYTNLYRFTAALTNSLLQASTNSDGANPRAALILSGNTLYGTAYHGGYTGAGTVFAIDTDGTGFTNLHSFTFIPFANPSDGANPAAGLLLPGNTLYGTTSEGAKGQGAVFALNTAGTAFTNLHVFSGLGDGAYPQGEMVLSGNDLYGTTSGGGSWGRGIVFRISLPPPPPLTITLGGPNVILTWTNTPSGFTLQSTTNLSPAAWSTVSPAPAIVNGQNTVTNPISGTQQLYRLSR